MSIPETQAFVNPLLAKNIGSLDNWTEWLRRWQAAEDLQTLEGLLHFGFSVSFDSHWASEERMRDQVDRVVFFLSVADGWTDSFSLQASSDNRTVDVWSDKDGRFKPEHRCELRKRLARKAFDVLCQNFFRPCVLGREFDAVWEEQILSERLFPVIQHFFRVEKGRSNLTPRLHNVAHREDSSHSEKIAVEFLTNLAVFLWKWEKPNVIYASGSNKDKEIAEAEEYYRVLRDRIEEAKPWMVEVLCQLGRFNVLRKLMLELEDSCIAKLHEIAMRSELNMHEHPVRENRKVATLHEACYVGSRAALFLNELKLHRAEHERLMAIESAQEEAENAQAKLKELTSK